MVRRYVAPILRVVLFLLILMTPSSSRRSPEGGDRGRFLVTPPEPRPRGEAGDRWPGGPRLPASAPAKLLEARDGKFSWRRPREKDREGWPRPAPSSSWTGPSRSSRRWSRARSSFSPRTTGPSFRRPISARRSGATPRVPRPGSSSADGRAGSRRRRASGRTPPNAPASSRPSGRAAAPAPDDGHSVRRRGVPAGDRAFAGAGDGRGGEAQASPLLRTPGRSEGADLSARAARADLGEYSLRSLVRGVRVPDGALPPPGRARRRHAKRGAAEAALASRDAASTRRRRRPSWRPTREKRSADRLNSPPDEVLRASSSPTAAASPAATGQRSVCPRRPDAPDRDAERRARRDSAAPIAGADPTTLAFDATGIRLAWTNRRSRGVAGPASSTSRVPSWSSPRPAPNRSSSRWRGARRPEARPRRTGIRPFSLLARRPAPLVVLEVSRRRHADPRRHVLCDTEGKARPVVVERPFCAGRRRLGAGDRGAREAER